MLKQESHLEGIRTAIGKDKLNLLENTVVDTIADGASRRKSFRFN